jgi:hypothetical protein
MMDGHHLDGAGMMAQPGAWNDGPAPGQKKHDLVTREKEEQEALRSNKGETH